MKQKQSITFILVWTFSLHIKHFLTRLAHEWHVTICEHGWNKVSRLLSEQTRHSIEWLFSNNCWLLLLCWRLYSLKKNSKYF
jgi:hypothetical protein